MNQPSLTFTWLQKNSQEHLIARHKIFDPDAQKSPNKMNINYFGSLPPYVNELTRHFLNSLPGETDIDHKTSDGKLPRKSDFLDPQMVAVVLTVAVPVVTLAASMVNFCKEWLILQKEKGKEGKKTIKIKIEVGKKKIEIEGPLQLNQQKLEDKLFDLIDSDDPPKASVTVIEE